MLDMTGVGYVGDVGSIILIETNIVLTGATLIRINVYTPNKETKIWNASIDSTNNKYIRYVVQENDFAIPGTYFLQPQITKDGYNGKGETVKILIKQAFA